MSIGPLAKRILTRKLHATGWSEPGPDDHFTRDFYQQSFHYGLHRTLGMSKRQFHDWLEGATVKVEAPTAIAAPEKSVVVSAALLAALAAKPFVILAGTTGTGKTRTIRHCVSELSPEEVDGSFNHVFIPVEAGWVDGRHLIGYRNPFGKTGETYASTAVISLLLRANYPPYLNCPFFIILDEMNLSYVEMYFSRFLSLMETVAGGAPEAVLGSNELSLLHRSAPNATEATYIEHAMNSGGVFLTQNVFLVGTVNVDETTHMFSPKVLDRSFVLEFPTILPSQKPDDFAIPESDATQVRVSEAWKYLVNSRDVQPVKDEDGFLDTVYEMLGRFQFGPRITMEAQRYLAVVNRLTKVSECAETFFDSSMVKDRILMQKILPKLHGNRNQLEGVVTKLLRFAENSRFPRSQAKLKSMANDLKSPGFTNFFA